MNKKKLKTKSGKQREKEEKEKENRDGESSKNFDPDSLEGELVDALDVDDPRERERLIATFGKFTSSPVPPPKILKGYDEIAGDGAEWLLQYTKDEQLHRHRMDSRQLNYYSLGQAFGFVLGLVGIGGGIYLAANGVEWGGFGIFFTSLVSMVSLFVYNKQTEKKEKEG